MLHGLGHMWSSEMLRGRENAAVTPQYTTAVHRSAPVASAGESREIHTRFILLAHSPAHTRREAAGES